MKKNHKKTNNKKYAINLYLFIILILIIIFSISLFGLRAYSYSTIQSIKEIKYTINVTDYVGINLDSDKLHFGGIPPNGRATRSLSITSEKEGFVFIKSDGLDWITVNTQGQRINSNESLIFTFQAKVPKTAKQQNVEGTIHFYFTKTNKEWPLFFLKGKKIDGFTEEKQPSIKLNISN